MNKAKSNAPTLQGGASHPDQNRSAIQTQGTGKTEPIPEWTQTNRGAGTANTNDAGTAVGAGIKPTSQPMPSSDGADHPPNASEHPVGTGAAAPQPTEVATNFVPGSSGSPTQNRREPDGGVPVTSSMGAPTPKSSGGVGGAPEGTGPVAE